MDKNWELKQKYIKITSIDWGLYFIYEWGVISRSDVAIATNDQKGASTHYELV